MQSSSSDPVLLFQQMPSTTDTPYIIPSVSIMNPFDNSHAIFNSVANSLLTTTQYDKEDDDMGTPYERILRLKEENRRLKLQLQSKAIENEQLQAKCAKLEGQQMSVAGEENVKMQQTIYQFVGNLQTSPYFQQPKPKPQLPKPAASWLPAPEPAKPYACDFANCSKRYKKKMHLDAHRLRHTDRRFYCEFAGCNKSFARRYNLGEHVKMHSAENPNHCTIDDCDQVFSTQYALIRHQNAKHSLNL